VVVIEYAAKHPADHFRWRVTRRVHLFDEGTETFPTERPDVAITDPHHSDGVHEQPVPRFEVLLRDLAARPLVLVRSAGGRRVVPCGRRRARPR
jgi:hypothetical protein